jgi:YHS domain-containing protein
MLWKVIIAFVALVAIVVLAGTATELSARGVHGDLVSSDSVAIGGVDPLTYFEDDPTVADGAITHEYKGKTWRFVSQEHRQAFLESPEPYLPQYDGNCALGVSRGGIIEGSPRNWTVVNGKLYFNYNEIGNLLFKLIPGRIEKADAHFRMMARR